MPDTAVASWWASQMGQQGEDDDDEKGGETSKITTAPILVPETRKRLTPDGIGGSTAAW